MADTPELKKIKKIYGEKFKNLCRSMFPVILEQEGRLLSILENKFSHNCNSLYESITENGLETEFKNLIFEEFDPERKETEKTEEKSPYEILDEAGYNLYECKTEDDIQSFRKYYAPNEVLCTIYNGGRLATRDCFFAVRKDVDEIKRENFENPNKNDIYSTSVLGIQFTRDAMCTVEIISRYNHTVINPNCTLGNNLDRLAPRLGQSFANLLKERGLNFNNSQTKTGFEIPGYTFAGDGKYYKYNMEVNGTYYCPNNIIIENGVPREVIPLDRGMVIDNFYIDFKNKKINLADNGDRWNSFPDGLQDIEKIEVEKSENDGKVIKMYLNSKEKPAVIGVDKDNQIIKYENQYLHQVGDDFLMNNTALKELNLPKLQQVGNNFLFFNTVLTELNLPELQKVGDDFLSGNAAITELNLPKLQYAGGDFLSRNTVLTKLNLPELLGVDYRFLFDNNTLTELNLPKLQSVGDHFLRSNIALAELNLPQLRYVGNSFLGSNTALTELNLPELQEAVNSFLGSNTALAELNLPKLQGLGDCFLSSDITLTELNLPQLRYVGNSFLRSNITLTELNLPQLQYVGNSFLRSNVALTKLDLPELQKAGNSFLRSNTTLTELNLPKLQEVGDVFLSSNTALTELNLPELQRVGSDFLNRNHAMTKLNLPELQQVEDHFLRSNIALTELNLPKLQKVGDDFLFENAILIELNLPKLQKAGNSFLRCNTTLRVINLPKNPELEKLLREKNNFKNITPSDIAVVDKKSELTTSEIGSISGDIKKAMNKNNVEI